MSATERSPEPRSSPPPPAVDYKLEVLTSPSPTSTGPRPSTPRSGGARTRTFLREGFRVIQITPPGSQASVIFGDGVTGAQPGSYENLVLVVYDLDEARADLVARGVDVSEIFHSSAFDHNGRRVNGPDPEATPTRPSPPSATPTATAGCCRRSRRGSRGRRAMDVAALAELLHETAEHHDPFEKSSPPHNWWDWYAAYMAARQTAALEEAPPPPAATCRRRTGSWFPHEVAHLAPREPPAPAPIALLGPRRAAGPHLRLRPARPWAAPCGAVCGS